MTDVETATFAQNLQDFVSGKCNDSTYFMAFVFGIWGTRIALLKTLVAIGRSNWAETLRITKRPVINEKQWERESVWPIGYLLDSIFMFVLYVSFGTWTDMPFIYANYGLTEFLWNLLIHCTIVEFLYYWLHVLLHWQPIYKAYHQYHHKSINTEPTTALSFEFGERLSYTLLFAFPPIIGYYCGTQSYFGFISYLLWFDIMNEGGHINFEFFPRWFFNSPFKYVFYSATYHSVHHTKFKKNFSLFMPWPDMLFGTVLWGSHPYDSSSALTQPTEDV